MTNDRIAQSLLPNGAPQTPEERSEFFELYKVMVASSESLVARRQGVNTFFLTMNGLLLTAIGLFVRGGGEEGLKALGVFVLAIAGLVLCYAWRSLIISFGQLNTGKFAIINRMEKLLSASIFAAEWEALERGENPDVYRTFTSREVYVPRAFGVLYALTALLSGIAATGIWDLGG